MTDKQTLQTEVYDKIKALKNNFYECKTQDEWDEYKKELTVVLDRAKELMTPEFYTKYKEGVVGSISKTYEYKKKMWEKKQFTLQPKQSYIFREETDKALANLFNAMAEYYQAKAKWTK